MNKIEISGDQASQLEQFEQTFKLYLLLHPEKFRTLIKEILDEDRILLQVKTEFNTKQAAAYLRIKPKTLDNKLSNGEKIPYKLYGKFRKFIKDDLDAYIEANTKPGNFFVVQPLKDID